MKTTQARPFQGDSRAPFRRTAYVQGGLGKVEVDAPRRGQTAAGYGRDCERAAMRELQRDGYTVTRSHLSRGGADLVGIRHDGVVQVQVKACFSTYRPSWCNGGIREVAALPAAARRLVFGFLRSKGHVVTVEVHRNGSLSVTGREPYRSDVDRAVGRMRRKA